MSGRKIVEPFTLSVYSGLQARLNELSMAIKIHHFDHSATVNDKVQSEAIDKVQRRLIAPTASNVVLLLELVIAAFDEIMNHRSCYLHRKEKLQWQKEEVNNWIASIKANDFVWQDIPPLLLTLHYELNQEQENPKKY